MADESPSRSLDRIIIRLPEGMRTRLSAKAKSNRRSMTAEVVAILEEALAGTDAHGAKALASELRRITAEISVTNHSLNLLNDQRYRIRSMLEEMHPPVREGMRVFNRQYGDGTALSDARVNRDGEWLFAVAWDDDVDSQAPEDISADEVEVRGLLR